MSSNQAKANSPYSMVIAKCVNKRRRNGSGSVLKLSRKPLPASPRVGFAVANQGGGICDEAGSLPELQQVANTIFCDIGFTLENSGKRLIVSCLDYLSPGCRRPGA